MLTVAKAPATWEPLNPPGWAAALALVAVTSVAGPYLGAPARYLFLAGALGVGAYAWRQSPSAHLEAALVLFAFTPFARRMVDLSTGYDYAGMMIAGPLLMLLAPALDTQRSLFNSRILDRRLAPHFVLGGCVIYAVVLSILNGDWSQAVSGGLKWGAPLIYGMLLYAARPDPRVLLDRMAAMLIWILPVIGLYGIYQYIDPPLWDRFWLAMASIKSAGSPEPFEVRTFSTMHAPAAFATFTAAGLLVVAFIRNGVLTRALLIPAAVALLLSLYRTAWLSLIASVIFCLFFQPTRMKAAVAVAVAVIVVAAAIAIVPFSDVISGRLATISDPTNDPSGQERLGQFFALYGRSDTSLWGNGFSAVDVGVAGAEAVDGMLIACWTSMGIVVGLIYLSALAVLMLMAISAASASQNMHGVIAGAATAGFLVQIPLATVVAGELGFLCLTFATLALCTEREGQA